MSESDEGSICVFFFLTGRVGKTSMTLRFINNVFSDKQTATIQASYLTKRVTVDNQMVTLAVWVSSSKSHHHPLLQKFGNF